MLWFLGLSWSFYLAVRVWVWLSTPPVFQTVSVQSFPAGSWLKFSGGELVAGPTKDVKDE